MKSLKKKGPDICFAMIAAVLACAPLMLNAGILNGDIVIVEKTPYAQNGEIVVALIGDEATVKTFYKEKGYFRLQPENDAYEPIIVKEVIILGRVKGLIRNY